MNLDEESADKYMKHLRQKKQEKKTVSLSSEWWTFFIHRIQKNIWELPSMPEVRCEQHNVIEVSLVYQLRVVVLVL